MNQVNKIIIVLFTVLLSCNKIQATGVDSCNYFIAKALGFKNKNIDSLTCFANKAYLIAQNQNDYNLKLDVLIVLIESKIRSGELLEALDLCDSLKSISNNNVLIHREADVLLNIGNVYLAAGFAAEALEFFFKALNKPNASISTKNKVDIYYYIAIVYFDLGNIIECRKFLKQSINLASTYNYKKDMFSAYMLYANSFNNYDSVHKYMLLTEQLIDLYPNLLYEKVVLLSNKALLNKTIGNYNLSNYLYLEAMEIAKNNGFKEALCNIRNNYSYLLMNLSKFDSAKYYLEEALSYSIKLNNLNLESEIYDSFSDYYESIGDFQNALKYADLFIEKRDEYREKQKIQRSQYLTAVFETEQKEREILQKENEIAQLWIYLLSIVTVLLIAIGLIVYYKQKVSLSKSKVEAMEKGKSLEIANAIIEGQDAERKRLAMDLHDGLAARLGTLGFIFDGYFKDHSKYNEVTESIRKIHQNVRELSHRMLPTQLERLGVVKAISELANSVSESGKFNIQFDTNVEDRLSKKLEVNIYFMVYELINNATRHSKGQSIFVQLFKHDNILNLSVEDNGGGFVYDENKQGLGLENIKTRVEYLAGKITVESNESDTIFMIEIPISEND